MQGCGMKRTHFISMVVASLALSLLGPSAIAAVKAGGSCKKLGQTSIDSGKKYTCIKSGKRLVWSKGVIVVKTVPTPTPTSTSEPTPTPTPTSTSEPTPTPTPTPVVTPSPSPTPASTSNKAPVVWRFDGKEWISQGSVPQCPSPLIPTGELLDFSKVLSIVQPGQIRGGSYKPHAGLRWSEFGGVVKGISIKAPFDGEVAAAAQYISEGNYQFTINIIHPCGIMLRLGHLLEPSDSIKKILSTIPPAIENDSRESFLSGTFIKKDQLIASEVGMVPPASPDSLGTFMDLGIVDLRKKNPALDSSFKSNADVKYSLYSVCWYEGNYFSDSDRARVLNLPYSNGDATSDYCKRR